MGGTFTPALKCSPGGNGISNAKIGVNIYSFAPMFGQAYTSIAALSSNGVYYVAGGGGGSGVTKSSGLICATGLGGGGDGCMSYDGATPCAGGNAKAGTGGGGGGGAASSSGGMGGSGLVLVRVPQCQCTKGQYYNLTGPDGCFTCVGNTYCPLSGGCGSGCIACPTRTYADANHTTCIAATCTICPRGSYCQGGTFMQGCPAGTYGSRPGLAAVGDCTPCQVIHCHCLLF